MPTPTTANRNYPLPHPDNELDTDVQRLVSALHAIDTDVAALLVSVSQAALGTHGHVIGDVTGLQAALDAKAASGHTHAINDLTDVDITGAPAGRPLTTQVGGGVGIGPAPMTQAQVDAAIAAAISGKLDAAGPTIQSGYLQMMPYSSSYDDGSFLQGYYNGNGRELKLYAKNSGNNVVDVDLELTGGIRTTGPITVGGKQVWHADNDGSGSGLDADLLDGKQSSVSAAANSIVARNGSADIYVRYLWSEYVRLSHPQATRLSDTVFYSSDDEYIRKNTKEGFLASLGLSNVAPVYTASNVFSSSGNWVVPTGVNRLFVVVVGAGGGGASPNTYFSGSSGGAVAGILSVTPGASLPVTVGAGNSGHQNNYNFAGSSSFGPITASGGRNGSSYASGPAVAQADCAGGLLVGIGAVLSLYAAVVPFTADLEKWAAQGGLSGNTGSAAIPYNIDGPYRPGSPGISGPSYSTGGVGGAVFIFF